MAPPGGDDILLGAAGIGHHRRRTECGCDQRKKGGDLAHRRSEQHEIGVDELVGPALILRPGPIGDTQLPRRAQVGRAASDTNHRRDRCRSFERECEGSANQADAHDHHFSERRDGHGVSFYRVRRCQRPPAARKESACSPPRDPP